MLTPTVAAKPEIKTPTKVPAPDADAVQALVQTVTKALTTDNIDDMVSCFIASEDAVACEVVETATFTGPMELPSGVIAPTNRAYTLPVGSFFRFDPRGLIRRQRTYWDTASWAQQIGIDPKRLVPSAVSNNANRAGSELM